MCKPALHAVCGVKRAQCERFRNGGIERRDSEGEPRIRVARSGSRGVSWCEILTLSLGEPVP